MKKVILFISVFLSIVTLNLSQAQTSNLVYIGSNGRLEYNTYSNWGQTNSVNKIPDFSFVGYRGGGIPIPDVQVVEIVNPIIGDAKSLIQSAIDRTSLLPLDANGIRGAVLLKAGKYEVNGSIYIKASGVILRGVGQNSSDKGGTELVATSKIQHDFIKFQGNESSTEPTSELILDTKVYPAANTLQEFNVLKGVVEELEGDKIISFHVTADVNQFVSYASREDSPRNHPVLEITISSKTTGIDSVMLFIPIADTYVQGGTSAKLNFGSDSSFAVKNAGVNANVSRETYLKFSLLIVRDSIKKAVLKLYTKKDLAGDPAAIKIVNISVSYIKNDSWEEKTLTYETRPVSGESVGARRITTTYVSTGSVSFEIDDVTGLVVGDTILVTRTPNDAWISVLNMAQYGWVDSEYRISYERIITSINGKAISINIPIMQAIEILYGGGEVSKVSVKGRLNNCGIENMMLTSFYENDTDENHGWSSVTLSETKDCWVRKVTARYFGYSCVGLYWAYNTSVEECAMLDPKSITTGSRKYSFYIDKGSFNLFQRCYARGGRHDFVTGSRVAGPNVFVDCFSTETYADIGPHHRYATGILFDNIRGGETRVQNRKDMGSGHGWAGAQTMFWNCRSDVSEFKVESPIGAMNWGIGCSGQLQSGAGFWENWGTPVVPRSIYFQQLKDRLGNSAVESITLPIQLTGSIWSHLSTWAGIGDLAVLTKIFSGEESIPRQFSLFQNYPNPFNPSTIIQFTVPKTGHAKLSVFNLVGQEVAILYNKEAESGKFNNVQFDATGLATGLYFSRLEFEGKSILIKLLLIR